MLQHVLDGTHTQQSNTDSDQFRLSEIISALSYSLDITEGQPEGHAVRSCIIGSRLAAELKLDSRRRAALFYALLLKDVGCSSNAAKICWLFQADDRKVKHDLKLVEWTDFLSAAKFAVGQVLPGASFAQRLFKVLGMAPKSDQTSRNLVKVRCERGAEITRMIGFPEETAQAILALDEHWDGNGHPLGLSGENIPLGARICSLAQTMEVFISNHSLETACQVARRRSGKWFQPELVEVFLNVAKDPEFAISLKGTSSHSGLESLIPEDQILGVDDSTLDSVALAFSDVIDAKSPWTLRHSRGVSEIAVGIAATMNFAEDQIKELRRAGLLHDIGKLGVSNMILDKPGKLTAEEFEQMKAHTFHTQKILERVSCFRRFADYASAHHERMDGNGYHRSLAGQSIPLEARILAVADVCEALTAERPYRSGMPADKVLEIITGDRGTAFCPDVVDAFMEYQDETNLFERLKDANCSSIDMCSIT